MASLKTEFLNKIHKFTLYPEVWGQKTTLSSVKLIQKFWDTFLKIFPLWCWVNFYHPQGSKVVWWGNFSAPKVQSGVGRWPPPKQVAPGTWHLLRKFKIEQIEPISCHFQSILNPQWENFLNPRSNQVWAGGHHPSRWHLAPTITQYRSNLVPLHVKNQANLTNFMSILNPKRDLYAT